MGPGPVDGGKRARILYGALLFVCAVFVVRAFYLQVIRHDYYSKAALNYQLKEYQVPAERGIILAQNGSTVTPLVLNEIKYTLFADPVYVEDADKAALDIAGVIGGDAQAIAELLRTPDTRYVVLAKRLSKEQHEAINRLEILGVGTREHSYRTYPQGRLAAQTLGFVNEDGEGQYGIEQFMDESLSGKPGELRAITDARGVPLVSNPDNIVIEPESGQAVILTLDIGMQQQAEEILKKGLENSKGKSGSIVIMDPTNGQVKAMANYPSYDPENIAATENLADFSNAAVSTPFEVGSIMKTLTAAAALNQGVVSPHTAFYDKGYVQFGDRKITDTHNSEGTQTVESLLVESLNTGAVWLLEQIGRGSLNERARLTWHSYMTEHYYLGKPTGIEQAGEAGGYIPSPEDNGAGIDLTYANTSFGQAMTSTTLQMAAAYSAVINGGLYYQPTIVDSTRDSNGHESPNQPRIIRDDVVSPQTSRDIIALLETVAKEHFVAKDALRDGYSVGGKTGTAEIARPAEEGGGYYTDRFNGTYAGFVGGDNPEYVIVVTVHEPKLPGYAGSQAAAPIFRDAVNMLLDNFGVTPKS